MANTYKPGVIPVTPRDASDANLIARDYLDSLQVEMRIMDAVEADTTLELFGKTFTTPIMTPAFSHLHKKGEDGLTQMEEYAKAAHTIGAVNFVGMESDETFAAISAQCPGSIRIIKPFADHDRVFSEIAFAKEQGALAVGMDIDHVFQANGSYDVVDGSQMGPITTEQLAEYVKAAGIPFIAKGVLSVTDAVKCVKAGCAAIMVSHHHGRLPYAVAPVMVLPDIKDAVGDSVKVFVDCSISSGYDAYKAMALGADAVCVGRGILDPLLKEGTEGVIKKMTKMNEELKLMMGFTNTPTLADFDPSVIY